MTMTMLFLNDWKKYPNSILHTSTSNKSFIRLSGIYREMGIKNHAFLLALLNPILESIDPFSDNLTMEQITLIIAECKMNPWYYFREISRVPALSGSDVRQLKANKGNISLFWLFFNSITNILVQIRQTGKSLSANSLAVYLLNIRCKDTEINFLTERDELRSETLDRIRNIEHELPWYLKQRKDIDISNTEELSIKSMGNRIRGHLSSKSPRYASVVGRGFTSPIFFIDEAAYIPNICEALPAALSAGNAARDIAKQYNEPHGTILMTTAGKKDDRDGGYILKLIQDSADWSDFFLDAFNRDDLIKIISKATGLPEENARVCSTFNHRQLGYTDDWLRRKIAESMASGDVADRDYFNKWTSGNQKSPLPIHSMEMIRSSMKEVVFTDISRPYGYITRWYIPEYKIKDSLNNKSHVLSLDTSDATGRDDIALMIRNITTGEVVAVGNYNETNLITFSEWLVSWFIDYHKLVAIIERRSSGATIIDYLLLVLMSKDIDPFKCLYNTIVNDKETHSEKFKEINKPLYMRDQDLIVKYKKHFGFATSGYGITSRTELYNTTLLNAVKYTSDKIYDKKTIDQILSLEEKNGRIDHSSGNHDDNVIAWLLGYWFITQAKNLDFYNIDSRSSFSPILSNIEDLSSPDIFELKRNAYIKNEIALLLEKLAVTNDYFLSLKLERDIKNLTEQLSIHTKEKISVDDLFKEIKEHKKLNSMIQQKQYNTGINYNPYKYR